MGAGTFTRRGYAFLSGARFERPFIEFAHDVGVPINIPIAHTAAAAGTTDEVLFAVPKGLVFLLTKYDAISNAAGAWSAMLYDAPTVAGGISDINVRTATFVGSLSVGGSIAYDFTSNPPLFAAGVCMASGGNVPVNTMSWIQLAGLLVEVERYEQWLAERRGVSRGR